MKARVGDKYLTSPKDKVKTTPDQVYGAVDNPDDIISKSALADNIYIPSLIPEVLNLLKKSDPSHKRWTDPTSSWLKLLNAAQEFSDQAITTKKNSGFLGPQDKDLDLLKSKNDNLVESLKKLQIDAKNEGEVKVAKCVICIIQGMYEGAIQRDLNGEFVTNQMYNAKKTTRTGALANLHEAAIHLVSEQVKDAKFSDEIKRQNDNLTIYLHGEKGVFKKWPKVEEQKAEAAQENKESKSLSTTSLMLAKVINPLDKVVAFIKENESKEVKSVVAYNPDLAKYLNLSPKEIEKWQACENAIKSAEELADYSHPESGIMTIINLFSYAAGTVATKVNVYLGRAEDLSVQIESVNNMIFDKIQAAKKMDQIILIKNTISPSLEIMFEALNLYIAKLNKLKDTDPAKASLYYVKELRDMIIFRDVQKLHPLVLLYQIDGLVNKIDQIKKDQILAKNKNADVKDVKDENLAKIINPQWAQMQLILKDHAAELRALGVIPDQKATPDKKAAEPSQPAVREKQSAHITVTRMKNG